MLDTLTTLTLPYLLALLGLALQWLVAVRAQSRLGRRPVLAYVAAPGVAALLAAPLAQADPLFGLGAALLLIAAYAGGAYGTAPPGHRARALRWGGGLLTLLLLATAALTGTAAWTAQAVTVQAVVWPLLTGILLLLLGYLLSAGPAHAVRAKPPGLALRFGALNTPAWPDLELHFDGDRARVQNIGTATLLLAGWSGSSENGWLLVRDVQGQPLTRLARGATATLAPWPAGERGVRVWYVRQSEPEHALVFRADWTPPGSPSRVLN